MENNFSALKSIQELKNLLDSGAITQQEYEVLKQKIIFGDNSGVSAATSAPQAPVRPVRPDVSGPVATPAPLQERVYPRAVEGIPATPAYQHPTNPGPQVSPADPVSENKKNENFRSLTLNETEEPAEVKRKDWLLTILITLAVILLIGLVAYYLFSEPDSERLTSKSGAETEEVITAETPASAEPTPAAVLTAPGPAENPAEVVPPANIPAETTVPESSTAPATPNPVVTETTPPPAAAPNTLEVEAMNKIKERLQAYYSDMKSAPFSAQNHFAPAVERYYTLSGTTPQAINENINSYHFNEFQDSQSSIEEGSLKMTGSGNNGYEVTYIEHGSAFRKSKGQKQETTARVRARFDKDFKLTYFRQEQLLENRFIDE